MNHKEYTSSVERKEYPSDPFCPLGSKFENTAGEILNLIEDAPLNAVAIIRSHKGSHRSNHYHTGSVDHYLYCLSGEFEYYERGIDEIVDKETFKPLIVREGQMVWTGPYRVHLTIFTQDTVLISLGSNPRSHKDHENTIVREMFFK